MQHLFVVRHGETQANENDLDAGPLDYPLTKRGKKEASFVSDALSRIDLDAVYCSPVHRAVQTAKILAKPHKLKAKPLDDLIEAKLKPSYVGEPGRHHILLTPDAFQETYEEVQHRVLNAVDQIHEEVKGNSIMVTHGDVIVALLQAVLERKEQSGYYVLHPSAGSLSVIEYTDRPRLVLFDFHRKLFDKYAPSKKVKKST